jgi:cytochrome P450
VQYAGVRAIRIQHNDSFERKSPGQRTSLAPVAGDGLVVSDGKVWRRRRRIVAPIVHISRMSEFAPIMVDTAHGARERWAARLSLPAEIDVLSEMAQLTAEIICRAVFGRQLGSDRALQIVKGFSEYQRRVGQFDLLTLLGVPEWLPRFHPPSVYRSARRIHKVLDELIAEHRAHRDGAAGPANPDRGLRAVRSQLVSSPKIRTLGAADFNPFVRYGAAEGGDPSPLFDADCILRNTRTCVRAE